MIPKETVFVTPTSYPYDTKKEKDPLRGLQHDTKELQDEREERDEEDNQKTHPPRTNSVDVISDLERKVSPLFHGPSSGLPVD